MEDPYHMLWVHMWGVTLYDGVNDVIKDADA